MKITVYMTGGIACYKAVNVVRQLEKDGHQVRVVMTKNAEQFVTAQTLAALTKYPVLDDLWAKENQAKIAHVHLARWTELALVVPATANFIAKMANGIADDAASTTILATAAPKMIIPAMNDQMLNNPATQRNLTFLKNNNVNIMQPATGMLAEGYEAKGRMPEPDKIVNWVKEKVFSKRILVGKKIIITAGGTQEAIDPVRYIGNYSSGKMGIALAEAAKNAGADVTLIYGKISVSLPSGVKTVHVQTALEMKKAVEANFKQADILIMAAAVADWRAAKAATSKIKKQSGQDEWNLKLVKNPDILRTICQKKTSQQIVVGFAAETNNLLANAQKKLKSKGADLIIANNVSVNSFGSDQNQVYLLYRNGKIQELPQMTKKTLAQKIMEKLASFVTQM